MGLNIADELSIAQCHLLFQFDLLHSVDGVLLVVRGLLFLPAEALRMCHNNLTIFVNSSNDARRNEVCWELSCLLVLVHLWKIEAFIK